MCVCTSGPDSVCNHQIWLSFSAGSFISDLRCNIHAAKLHFFCVQLSKELRIEQLEALAGELQALPKLFQIVVQSNDSYSEQPPSNTMIYGHRENVYCTLAYCTTITEEDLCGALLSVRFLLDFMVPKKKKVCTILNARGSWTL